MFAEATPTHRHSPGVDAAVVLTSLIPAHVGAGARIELISLEGVRRLSRGIEEDVHIHDTA